MSKAEEFRKRLIPEEKQTNKSTSIFETEKQIQQFSRVARYSTNTIVKLWGKSKNRNKTAKVKLKSIFATKEQEKIFAKCAKESMSTEAELHWDGEEER